MAALFSLPFFVGSGRFGSVRFCFSGNTGLAYVYSAGWFRVAEAGCRGRYPSENECVHSKAGTAPAKVIHVYK